MTNSVQFRARLSIGGEILAGSATFLPVETARPGAHGGMFLPAMRHLLGFPPFFSFTRENFPVAQPLLKEACDEMR